MRGREDSYLEVDMGALPNSKTRVLQDCKPPPTMETRMQRMIPKSAQLFLGLCPTYEKINPLKSFH